jgi:5,6-dimethylbenzimidazole synthase
MTTDNETAAVGSDEAQARYDALMEIVRSRRTSRAFDPDYIVPDAHFEMILEAARHGPSGANAQPWHFIVVREPQLKEQLGGYFVAEATRRAKMKMKFPTPNYAGMKTAPGLIAVLTDFRFVRAFPVLNDGSELDAMYQANAERILLQSVAAATMSAHLAAAALGYAVWWVTAIGQEEAQKAFKPLLGVPEELGVIDIMCFGPPKDPPYKRWKKSIDEIRSYDGYNEENFMTLEDIDEWVRASRHKVMYRDESKVD